MTNQAERWDRVKALVADALELQGADERQQFLTEACGTDVELREEVDELLSADQDSTKFLDTPLVVDAELSDSLLGLVGELAVGTRVGAYEITGKLGEGGFAIVYSAEQHEPIRRSVALKVVKPGMDSAQILARFDAERRTLARLRHPHIAAVLDAGTTSTGHPYFVLERVHGVPMTQYCKDARLAPEQRIELFLQMSEAVQHAHQKGIVHRDIKPSNVLVEEIDGVASVKVIDFGIAKALSGEAAGEDWLNTLTGAGMMIGTPDYMSPEQASMESVDIDTRADVYSMGALLYELLAGSRPFDRATLAGAAVMEIRRVICEVEPPKPSTRITQIEKETGETDLALDRRKLRGDLDWIVMKALEKDRDRRYPSALAFAEDLRRHRDHEPVLAGPPTVGYRLAKFARRNRGLLAAMVCIGLALATGLGFAISGFITAQEERDVARAAESSEREARGRSESALAEAQTVSDFLESMLESAEPQAGGHEVTVRELLDFAAEDVVGLDEEPIVAMRLRRVLGNTYRSLGSLEEAETHLVAALSLAEKHLGRDDETTMWLVRDVANLRITQTRSEEAEASIRDLLQRAEARFGPNHEITLAAKVMLSSRMFELGRLEDSVAISEQVVEAQAALYGPDSEAVISTKGNLAMMYMRLLRHDDALTLAKEVVELSTSVNGSEHPSTLRATHVFGTAHIASQNYKGAITIFDDLLERSRKVYGPDHMATMGSMNMLALGLQRDMQLDRAEKAYTNLVETQERALGKNHRQTMMALHNFAMLQQARGKLEVSESMLVDAVARMTETRGLNHFETVTGTYHLASVRGDLGRYEEAAPMFQESVEALLEILGPVHVTSREALFHHGRFLSEWADRDRKTNGGVDDELVKRLKAGYERLQQLAPSREKQRQELAVRLASWLRDLDRDDEAKIYEADSGG